MDDHDNESSEQVVDVDVEKKRKARVDAVWEQMNSTTINNKPPSTKTLNMSSFNKTTATANKMNNNKIHSNHHHHHPTSSSSSWMKTLGLMNMNPNKKIASTDESNKQIAAAALAALNNTTTTTTNSSSSSSSVGKIQITQIKDFAGQPIQVHKVVDADSIEASSIHNNPPSSAVDAVLEQIKKKQKLSVLDKTKKDWGEYKGENKGLEDELDAYKKSSNQYLDKVSFLERADYREFERERDARLALQSKKRSDTTT